MTNRLLTTLEARANSRGLLLANEATLAVESWYSTDMLRQQLATLEASGVLEILTPPPFLVIRLKVWSGKGRESSKAPNESRVREHRAHSYSLHNQSIDKSKAIAEVDRGVGEGEALLKEILATLGETDPATFRGVLGHYPVATISAALKRVRATPPGKIRKSRTALFRYLLARSK